MRETIRLPKLDQDMTEGRLLEWLVAPGDQVVKDQPVAVIETDKVSTELISSMNGVVVSIFVAAGADAPVGAELAEIASDGDADSDVHAERSPVDRDVKAKHSGVVSPEVASPPAIPLPFGQPKRGTGPEPLANTNAVQLPLERNWVRPHRTTPRARSFDAASMPSVLEVAHLLRPMQRTIVDAVERSWHIPQFSARTQISARRLLEVLAALRLPEGPRISLSHLLLKLAAKACSDVPELNAHYEGGQHILLESVNVNLLVAVGDDLLSPRIEDVCRKSLRKVADETTAVVEACRNRTVKRGELTPGSFSIMDLGMHELDNFTPLLAPPQVAILGIGRVTGEPASFHTTLVVDHRVLNGVHAARYLCSFRSLCEEPLQLL